MNWPCSSNRKQRSKSPSQAMPRSAPWASTASRVAARLSSSIGLGMPLGKLPSGWWLILMNSKGTPRALSAASMASSAGPAAPLPALTTSFSGLSALQSM
ncbi:hypothetical protein D3C80_1410430 [compost metagenome]